MPEAIHISLRYTGPEVDNGQMDINELAAALQGFSSAYAKVASQVAPEARHQLKVTAFRESSFDIFILAAIIAQAGNGFETIQTITDAAKHAFRLITEVIGLKKHTKSQPYTYNVTGNGNNVSVINAEKVEVNFPLDAFEMFLRKILDPDLNKITSPLSEERINSAELKEEAEGGLEVKIASTERPYFQPSTELHKAEREVTGTLVSLNKETNRGTFKFGNGTTARYSFIGDDKDSFHLDFSRKGAVRVSAIVEFDENLTPVHLEIKRVERAQLSLDLPDTQA